MANGSNIMKKKTYEYMMLAFEQKITHDNSSRLTTLNEPGFTS